MIISGNVHMEEKQETQGGKDWENLFFHIFRGGAIKERGQKIRLAGAKWGLEGIKYGARRATDDEDRNEGTDFFWATIRFDIAFCWDGNKETFLKDGMVTGFTAVYSGYYTDVYLAVRDRNSRGPFKRPVIVIGNSSNYRSDARRFAEFVDFHWEEIWGVAKKLRQKYLEFKKGKKGGQ